MDCSPPGSSVHGDSPGKNTGVGCHALLPTQGIFPTQGLKLHVLQLLHCRWSLYCWATGEALVIAYEEADSCRKKFLSGCVLSHFSHVRLFATLWTGAHQAPLSTGFSRKNTRVGCHALLQGTFPTQGSNPCLLCFLHWQAEFLPLVPPRKPFVWEKY